jgi:hypothetical protein
MSTITWNELQWDYFFALSNLYKIAIIKDLLEDKNSIKALRWAIQSSSGYTQDI